MSGPVVCPGSYPDPNVLDIAMPLDERDCHFCISDGPSEWVEQRSNTAPHAPYRACARVPETLGLSQGVVIQPSVYGTDNQTTFHGLDTTVCALITANADRMVWGSDWPDPQFSTGMSKNGDPRGSRDVQ